MCTLTKLAYPMSQLHVYAPRSTTAVQSQKAVSAYFTSKQILPFGFAEQTSSTGVDIDNNYCAHVSYILEV